MHVRQLSLAVLAAGTLLTGCTGENTDADGSEDRTSSPSTAPAEQPEATPSGGGRAWEPDDALQRTQRAVEAILDSDAEFVDSGRVAVASGLDKTLKTPGDRPYTFTITCDTEGIQELTLTLSRGKQEQAYGIGCGDPEADQFNIPAGGPFAAQIDPVEDGTGVIRWQLDTIGPDSVAGCPDDIDGCHDWLTS